jgi:peptide/nickel transport system permease protein
MPFVDNPYRISQHFTHTLFLAPLKRGIAARGRVGEYQKERMSKTARLLATLRGTLLRAVPSALGVVILSFFLTKLVPGDAADVLAGEAGSATAEGLAAMRARMGLDQSLITQLGVYLDRLAHLSLGWSLRYDMPVSQLIWQRLPNTLLLMAAGLVIALTAGIAMGFVMALYRGRWPDRILSVLSLLLYSAPGFWIGLMLITLFSVKLGWLPSGGAETIGGESNGLGDRIRYLALPSVSLALFYVAIYARLTRVAMIEVGQEDHVRTALAKGLSPFTVALRHVLRNALLPVTTVAGMHAGAMLGGAVVVEMVYSWPGLGRLAYEAVMGRDFPVLLGILLLSSFLVIVVNAAVDVLHAALDPRIGAVA